MKIKEIHKSNKNSVYSADNAASTNIIRIMLIMLSPAAHANFNELNYRCIKID